MFSPSLQILWDQYHDTFGEWFPTMCFPNDEGKLAEKLQQCLDEGKSAQAVFHLDYSEEIIY